MTVPIAILSAFAIGLVIVMVRAMREEDIAIAHNPVPLRPTPRPYDERDFQIGCLWSVIIALFGGALLAGVPGAAFIFVFEAIAGLVGWRPFEEMADGAWPVAIYISLLWPAPLAFAARWFARRYPGRPGPQRNAFAVIVAAATGLAITSCNAACYSITS